MLKYAPATQDHGNRMAARRNVCTDCAHFRDDVATCEPTSAPCALAPQWTTCKWRAFLRDGTMHPSGKCPLNKENI